MEGYKVRMQVEFSQLNSRVQKLQSFISDVKNGLKSIDEDELVLMETQLNYMTAYLSTLKKRCIIHNINI